MLTAEQIAAFWRDGFVLIEDALPAALIAAARDAADAVALGARGLSLSDDIYDLEDDHRPDAPRVRRIKSPHAVHPVFAALLRDARICGRVASLLGPDLRMEHTKLNMKPPGGGAAVAWHQDWAFYPHTNDDILEVGIMLDDSTAQSGPLLMVPGSHRGPVFDHHRDGVFCGAIDCQARGVDLSTAVALTGRAGAMTLHHVRALHGSAPNRSPDPRRLLLFGYCAADAWPLLGFGSLDALDARMVQGCPTLTPRLAPVPVRMPLPPARHPGSIFENQKEVRGRAFV